MSLRVVSSNPGVSIRMTRRPSRWKAPASWTEFVQDRSPRPTLRSDPLTRLMNCVDQDEAMMSFVGNLPRPAGKGGGERAHRRLAASRCTHDAMRSNGLTERRKSTGRRIRRKERKRTKRGETVRDCDFWDIGLLRIACEFRSLRSIIDGILQSGPPLRPWLRWAPASMSVSPVDQLRGSSEEISRLAPSGSTHCLLNC